MKRLAIAVACVALSSGCFSSTMRSGVRGNGDKESRLGFSLIYGLTGIDHAAPECDDGLAWVETHMPWWGGFVTGLTVGLVTPVATEYECAGRRRSDRSTEQTDFVSLR